MTDREYEVGESIAVPWGLDTVEGTVVGAYGEGSSQRVLVEVSIGDGATETLPFSLRALEVARDVEKQSPPGEWVTTARFEESVRNALAGALRYVNPLWGRREGSIQSHLRIADDLRIDVAVSLPDRLVIVEAKHYHPGKPVESTVAVDQLRHYLMQLRTRGAGRAVGLLIMDREPGMQLMERADSMRMEGFPIWVVEWEPGNPSADEELRKALNEAARYELAEL
ncbi:hypothetical protein [Streptomyces shaanxiensis]